MSIRSEKTENARNKLITSLIQDIAGQITFKDFEDFEKKMHLVLELGIPYEIIKHWKLGQ